MPIRRSVNSETEMFQIWVYFAFLTYCIIPTTYIVIIRAWLLNKVKEFVAKITFWNRLKDQFRFNNISFKKSEFEPVFHKD